MSVAVATFENEYIRGAALWLLIVFVFLAYLFGAGWAVVALGVAAVPVVLLSPRTGLWIGPALVPVAVSIAPQRWGDELITAPEYYYWAVGSFLVSLPLLFRLVWRWYSTPQDCWRQFRAARPVTIFLVICLAATSQAYRLGEDPAYIVRQLFGVFLFGLYFFATLQFVRSRQHAEQLMRPIIVTAAVASVYTILLFHDTGAVVGLFNHHLSILTSASAVYCAAQLAYVRRWSQKLLWAVVAAVLLANAFVFRSRVALTLAALTSVLSLGYFLFVYFERRKIVVAVCVCAVVLASLALLATPTSVGSDARNFVLGKIILDPSAICRLDQLLASFEIVKEHPLLGMGIGSKLTYFDPYVADYLTVANIDEGYAYLLSKVGLLGTGAFAWMLMSVMRKSGWPKNDAMHIGLFFLFIFHVIFQNNGPVFVHFLTAAWVGTTTGLLHQVRSFN